ncbi:unnamed protein product [Caenorhabditis bovis]|uniref:Uncharacterized protein n=1 Tax=Caenorhabditis bovis TaxID=2654633 RepID=A0A8S1FEM6_9PELO|nr:unnamed protein product [Caenorhabditis bovis]
MIENGFLLTDSAIWRRILLLCIKKTSKKENGPKYPLFNSFGSTNKLPKAEFIEEYDKLCEQFNGITPRVIGQLNKQKLYLACDFCKCRIKTHSSLASHVFSRAHGAILKETCEASKEDLEYWKRFIEEARSFKIAKVEIPLFNYLADIRPGENDWEFEKEYDKLAKRLSNIRLNYIAKVNTEKRLRLNCEYCINKCGKMVTYNSYHLIAQHVFSRKHGEMLKKRMLVSKTDVEYWRNFIEKAEQIAESDVLPKRRMLRPAEKKKKQTSGKRLLEEFLIVDVPVKAGFPIFSLDRLPNQVGVFHRFSSSYLTGLIKM